MRHTYLINSGIPANGHRPSFCRLSRDNFSLHNLIFLFLIFFFRGCTKILKAKSSTELM